MQKDSLTTKKSQILSEYLGCLVFCLFYYLNLSFAPNSKDPKDSKDSKDPKDSKDSKDVKDSKDSKDKENFVFTCINIAVPLTNFAFYDFGIRGTP